MTPENLFDAELAKAPCACGKQDRATCVRRTGPVRVGTTADSQFQRLKSETRCDVCGHRDQFVILRLVAEAVE